MRLGNNQLDGFRRPTEAEKNNLAAAWRSGTNAARLKSYQLFLLLFVLVMGLLRAAGGEEGFNLSAGIGSSVMFLLLASPFLLYWNRQIRKIRLYQQLLEQGDFRLALVRCQRVVSNRWNVHYVGFARIVLPDGTVQDRVPMPFKQADSLRTSQVSFDGIAVVMEGRQECLVFPG